MKYLVLFFSGVLLITSQISSKAQSIVVDTGLEEIDAITGNEIVACNGLVLRLRLDGFSGVNSYNWDFGNGNTSVLPNPVEQYNSVGTYTISVTIELSDGSTQVISSPVDFIEINNVNVVNILVDCTLLCLGEELVVSNDAPVGTFAEVEYLIDNQLYQGDASQDGYPAIVPMDKAGQFSIFMEGTHAQGCRLIENYSGIIEVVPPFEVRITPEKTYSCEDNAMVMYTAAIFDTDGNQVDDTNIQYDWDFGDGWQGLGKSLLHNYDRSSGKSFDISVTASSPAGCSNSITISDGMYFIDQTNGFEFNTLTPPYCTDYGAIVFTPLLENSLVGTELVWRFEDGSVKRSVYPEGVEHRFTNNTASSQTENVVMEIEGGVNFGCQFIRPILIPVLSRAEIQLDDTVFCQSPFTVSPILRDDSNLGNWYWQIRGESQRYGQNERAPQIPVNSIGSFTIEVVTEEGSNFCVLDSIRVRSEIPDFEIVGNDGGCLPFDGRYTISDVENVEIASVNWSLIQLENGTETEIETSNQRDFQFSINDDGNYKIEALVRTEPIGNNPSCEFVLEKPVDIRILPILDFEILPDSAICNETIVTFRNLSSFGGISTPYADSIKYEWDYTGGGSYDNAVNPQGDGRFQYDLADPFVFINVRLRAYYEGYDCEERILEKQVQILPPKAEFNYVNDECSPTLLQIENTSVGGDRFDWEIIVNGEVFTLSTTNASDDPVQHPNFPTFNGNPRGILPSEAFVEVSMVATEGTCTDGFSNTIQLAEEVGIPEIISVPTEVCVGRAAFFEGGELPVDAAYRWTFTHEDDSTTLLEFNSYTTAIFPKAGEWEGLYEVLLSPTCIRRVPIEPFTVLGTSFELDGNDQLCEGDSVIIEVSEVWTTSDTIQWKWLWNGEVLEEGTSTDGTIDNLEGIFPIEARFPQDDRQRITLNVFTDSCEWENDFLFNLTYPDFNIADNVTFDYGCEGTETKITPRIGPKGFLFFPFPSFQWQIFDGTDWVDTFEDDFDYGFPADFTFTFNFEEGEAYQLRLLVTDGNGCTSMEETSFEVPTSVIPEVDFSADVFSLDCPGFISFFDSADGTIGSSTPRVITENDSTTYEVPIVRWIWDFGDGNTATTLTGEVAHFYTKPSPPDSSYQVTLTIEEELPNGRTCRHESESKSITVGGVLGSFDIEKLIFYGEEDIDLTATIETPGIDPDSVALIWTSGDGQGGSSFPIQEFTYTIPDTVNLKTAEPALSFADADGCVTTADYAGTISILNCPTLSYEDTTLCATEEGLTVNLEDFNFIDFYEWEDSLNRAQIEGEIYFQWLREDGTVVAEGEGLNNVQFLSGTTSSNEIDPLDTDGEEITVKYWVVSDYTDFLNPQKSVSNQVSCEKETSFRITFRPPPTALFESVPQTGRCGQGIYLFDATTSLAGLGYTIESYQWDFGDGNTAEGLTTTHEFIGDGVYPVQLIVNSTSGCADTLVQDARIFPLPELQLSNQINCGTYEVSFVAEIQNPRVPLDSILNWEWDFNYDGILPQVDRAGQNLNQIVIDYEAENFGVEQYHQVWVKVTTVNGCEDSVVVDIPIFRFNPPQADFETSAQKICVSEVLSFTDRSQIDNQNISSLIPIPLPVGTNEINAWSWDFGDDSTSLAQNPVHEYSEVGDYTVKLIVSSERGCVDSTEVSIEVKEKPFTDIANSITICEAFLDTIFSTNYANPDWDYEWTKIAETGGTVQENYVRTDRVGITFDSINFETPSAIINTTFTVRTFDAELSTFCEDLDTVNLTIHRFPEIDGFVDNDTIYIPNCATEASIDAMTNPLPAYDFEWVLQATNGRVEAQSLSSPSLDISVAFFEDGQDQLFVSAIVEVSNQTSSCTDRKTINFHFLRTPNAEIIADKTEAPQSQQINLSSREVYPNSVYTWNQLSSTPNTASVQESVLGENLNLSNPTFPVGEIKVDFTYELIVSNEDCADRDTITVTFYKEPIFDLIFDSTGVCFEEETLIYPDSLIESGFIKTWSRITVTDQNGKAQAIQENRIRNGLDQRNVGFDTLRLYVPDLDETISEISATYVLKITNELNENIFSADTVTLSFYNRPNLVGGDTIYLCENTDELTVLDSNLTENSAYTYQWSITNTSGGTASLQDINSFNPTISDLTFDPLASRMLLTLNRVGSNRVNLDCQISEEIYLVIEPSIEARFEVNSQNPCKLGELTFDRSMTTLPNTYRWEWDLDNDGVFESSSDSLMLVRAYEEGIYIFSARTISPNGCIGDVFQQEIEIDNIFKPEIQLLSQACLNENVTIQFSSNYPEASVQEVSWDLNYHEHLGSNLTTNGLQINHQFDRVGLYTVFARVERTNGCIDTLSQIIEVGIRPEVVLEAPTYVCYGEWFTLEAQGGETYLWEDGSTEQRIDKLAEESRWVSVEVFSTTGCSSMDSVFIQVSPNTYTRDTLYKCFGEPLEIDARRIVTEGTAIRYSWSTGETNRLVSISQPDTYSVEVQTLHPSQANCTYTADFVVVDYPQLEIANDVIDHCFEDSQEVTISAPSFTDVLYEWQDTRETTQSVVRNKVGEYTVWMTDISNPLNCVTEQTITITDVCPNRMFAPDAFTPNNDGINDYFFLETAYTAEITLQIFNRWGEVIFERNYEDAVEASIPENGWDGKYRGELMPLGVYTFVVSYSSLGNEKQNFQKTGRITLAD
ncbi:PKD domain-containing protein [Sediminitomix flava]|uniref:Gliding motility-associated-like protein n=1 Tax=Sediminitomix flava TaxID=379075 RepID=A0A315ZFN5_SEDFL|nr:PKD domain-containing protein [Sediminitomix flava]PWJ44385.1 gliding motility-associated-like protein [Sediminitomix flava]